MSVWNGDKTGRFERGWQPCSNYRPTDDCMVGFGNEHECYCRKLGIPCESSVSFCGSCHSDHHAGGYETCGGCGPTWAEKDKTGGAT